MPDHHNLDHDNKPTVSAVFVSGLLSQEGLFMFFLDVDEGILEILFSISPREYLEGVT